MSTLVSEAGTEAEGQGGEGEELVRQGAELRDPDQGWHPPFTLHAASGPAKQYGG